MNGLPRVAERTVDDLDRVLLPGQDDERDGAGFGQAAFLGGPGMSGPATGANLRGDYSTAFREPNVTQVAASQSLQGPISTLGADPGRLRSAWRPSRGLTEYGGNR